MIGILVSVRQVKKCNLYFFLYTALRLGILTRGAARSIVCDERRLNGWHFALSYWMCYISVLCHFYRCFWYMLIGDEFFLSVEGDECRIWEVEGMWCVFKNCRFPGGFFRGFERCAPPTSGSMVLVSGFWYFLSLIWLDEVVLWWIYRFFRIEEIT